MWNIRRFYNQNRKSIWVILLIIFFLLLVLKLTDYFIGKKNSNKVVIDENTTNTYSSESNTVIKSDKSPVSGETVSQDNLKTANELIETFFEYCNKAKYEEAYDLLTEDCKNEMYPSIQVFKESYCDKIFNNGEKNISAENWVNNIYKVKISDDFLSSGEYTKQNTVQDYITIDKDDNNEYKLNINGYIGKKSINKEVEKEKINIKVIEKNEYMDYTTYTFEVTNNSFRTIMLDSLKNTDSMYLEENDKVKYVPYTHELSDAQMIIKAGEKKNIKIKYYSKFTSNKKIDKIVFSRIILDYDRYSNFENKSYYNEYCTFEINI